MAITALVLNCTLKRSPDASNTEALARVVMTRSPRTRSRAKIVRVVDHVVHPGVSSDEGDGDEWPAIRSKLLDSEILIIASPTWLGQPSSIAKRTAAANLATVAKALANEPLPVPAD
jgi:multimeric flavodoxin WrbA